MLGTRDRGDVVARDTEVENVKFIRDKREKKTLNIPESVVEEMDLESVEEEEDFRKEQRNEVRVEIPHDILRVQDVSGLGPIGVLSTTFLQGLMSECMDIGEEYDMSVQAIVEDLEQSAKEVGLSSSPSRVIKEELIEREETLKERRKVGDGKVSSESTKEVERIIIEYSVEGESYMVRTVGTERRVEEGEEPVPPRDVIMPIVESIPVEGRGKGKGNLKLRPLIAPNFFLWVEPEKKPDKRESSSSGSESSTSKRSVTNEN